MSRSKTYRNISAKVRFFGLEVGDWGLLAMAAGGLFSLVGSLVFNLAAVLGLWLWMSRVKARKPEGYTSACLGHLSSPRRLRAEAEPNHDS